MAYPFTEHQPALCIPSMNTEASVQLWFGQFLHQRTRGVLELSLLPLTLCDEKIEETASVAMKRTSGLESTTISPTSWVNVRRRTAYAA